MLKCIKAFIRPKSLSFYLMLFNAIQREGRGLMLLIGHMPGKSCSSPLLSLKINLKTNTCKVKANHSP